MKVTIPETENKNEIEISSADTVEIEFPNGTKLVISDNDEDGIPVVLFPPKPTGQNDDASTPKDLQWTILTKQKHSP